jgi:hypothetical protein
MKTKTLKERAKKSFIAAMKTKTLKERAKKSFIAVMKTKTLKEKARKVLHSSDEDQNAQRKNKKSPS